MQIARTGLAVAAAAVLTFAFTSQGVHAGSDSITRSLDRENRQLRASVRQMSDENRRLEKRLRKLERNMDVDKQVLTERNAALERLLEERERLVDARASEAYAQGRLEMAAEIIEGLEIRGVPTRRERWIGADHFFAFEVWYDNRRVVRMPVQTKGAEDPKKMLLSSAVSAASLFAGF